jgi:hypothetical protein
MDHISQVEQNNEMRKRANARLKLQMVAQRVRTIASLGGNLPDDRLTSRTGPNDAAARGLMYTEARRLANEIESILEEVEL